MESLLQLAMRTDSKVVANLDCIGAAETLLLDDIGDRLPRSQQECPDRRRNSCRNLSNKLIADDTRSARHM